MNGALENEIIHRRQQGRRSSARSRDRRRGIHLRPIHQTAGRAPFNQRTNGPEAGRSFSSTTQEPRATTRTTAQPVCPVWRSRNGVSRPAAQTSTLPSRIRYYCRFQLLVIDEFGFEKLERLEYPEWSSLLYKVIDSRNRRGSTALVTNIDFKYWTDYLGDPPLAMALLDRVVDGAIIHKFKGESYRPQRGRRKPTGGKPTSHEK